ncbi:MAG: ATP-binding cassette domain-containing protein, partial [Planctomycetes bacterium]|nr:ATP-binding cassette domain-containing protein [Planctomycetota bacterium]
ARIGFLTASTGVYERLTPREILAFFGRLHRMDEERLATRTDELLDLFELRAHADRLCGTLSTGTRQKVNVARSVVHDPPVLIFDEPTAGLDCVVARTVTDFLRLARERGRAILLSGHRMEEVERLCDDAAILFDGKIRTEGSLDELRATWAEPTLEGIFFAAIAREKAGATHGP